MANEVRSCLLNQLDIAWALTQYHLESLTTEACLWRPAERGLHVWQGADGRWSADWPDHEGYDLGPSSLGWLTWHLGFWWSMVLDHASGEGSLTREAVFWPGDADGVRSWVAGLEQRWRGFVSAQSEAELHATERTRWPFQERPLSDLIAWANVELTKSAAEIGYARFLHAVRRP
ncbi:MAG: DinB family protein [Polyangiales bacterium]